MKRWSFIFLLSCAVAFADDWSDLVRDRTSIERIYYSNGEPAKC